MLPKPPTNADVYALATEVERLRELIRDQNTLARTNADLRDKLERNKLQRKELQKEFAEIRNQAGTLIRALYYGMSEFDQRQFRAPSSILMVDLDLPCELDDHAALVERARMLSNYYESGAKM